jgi:hypothetical protein
VVQVLLMQDFADGRERLMAEHRAVAGSGFATAMAFAGATAFAVTGLALAGTASADDGNPAHPTIGRTAKAVEHIAARPVKIVEHVIGAAATAIPHIVPGPATTVPGLFGGKVPNLFGGVIGNVLGAAGTATSHPINTRSIAQIQSQQQAAANLSEIIQQSGIDNNNAVAAQEELQREQQILVKANTLAQGIQNGTISNTQEVQVIRYIAQAKALQAQAHARFRNNIN